MKTPITALALAFAAIAHAQPLSLAEAVDTALRQNPTLRAAASEVEAARAKTRMARSRLGPQVSLNAWANSGSMPAIVGNPMGFDPPAWMGTPDGALLALDLAVMVPILSGGALPALVAAENAGEAAARANASAMRADVALMAREAYLQAQLAREIAKAQADRVRASEEMVRVAKVRFEAGSAIEAEVKRAEAELADSRRELAMAENDGGKMLAELRAVLALPGDAEIEAADPLVAVPVQGELADILASAKANRGELLAARASSNAAQSRRRAAQGATQPQLSAYAMGDLTRSRTSMGTMTDQGHAFGLTLSFPLFDGGMRKAEIAERRAMADIADSEVRVWELRTEREVRQAWLDLATAQRNRQAASAGVEAAQTAYDVVALRVANGKSPLVEQLDALAALTRARANLAQADFDHQIAAARLARAAGGV